MALYAGPNTKYSKIATVPYGTKLTYTYGNDAEEYVRTWLKENHLPDIEAWLGEKDFMTVFPWDFIDSGATKEYLWMRFQKACLQEPQNSPRCLTRCSGCGACPPEHQKKMAEYRRLKKKDVMIELDGLPGSWILRWMNCTAS